MFANSLRPVGREYRIAPSRFETPAGRQEWPPKSPNRVTLAPRCCGTGRVREGRQVRRDETHWSFIVDGQKKTPRPGARGAVGACEDSHGTNNAAPASKLIAEADQIATSIPFMMTIKRKHVAGGRVLKLWLQALAARRQEQAV